ncbi:DUF7344 domain-containing protein [Halodesulfurarchaeum sp.]|uniref:DUF7344 domain-containing protein n=1 Tax=Halodesulfurarchaeum sp. TaxID=1980530 RepID=UPI001BC3CF58|nr:hypothetical protein [Halodesulfurarchaeum sp.]
MQEKHPRGQLGSTTGPNSNGADGEPINVGAPPLTTEEIFHILSNRRRRFALHYLDQVEDPVTIRDLSEQIAAWEHDIDRSAVTPKQRKRTYTALHQGHLPKLDRLGVIEYDNERGIVAPSEHVKDFDVYLHDVPQDDIPWDEFTLGFGAVLSALVFVGWLSIPPFGGVDGFLYAAFAALSITVLGGYRVLTDTKTHLGRTAAPTEITPPNEFDLYE